MQVAPPTSEPEGRKCWGSPSALQRLQRLLWLRCPCSPSHALQAPAHQHRASTRFSAVPIPATPAPSSAPAAGSGGSRSAFKQGCPLHDNRSNCCLINGPCNCACVAGFGFVLAHAPTTASVDAACRVSRRIRTLIRPSGTIEDSMWISADSDKSCYQ